MVLSCMRGRWSIGALAGAFAAVVVALLVIPDHPPRPVRIPAVAVPTLPPLPVVTVPRRVTELERLLRLGMPVHCGGQRTRYVALTFDDGPGPDTALALGILR